MVKKTIEKRYYISSLLRNINTFSQAIRSHWEIENKLHWQMDFTFKCDSNQTVNKRIYKKILNLVKEDYKRSLKKRRFFIKFHNFVLSVMYN